MAVLVAGGAALAAASPDDGDDAAAATVADTSLATVTRQTLTAQTRLDGTLGHAGTYDVVNHARGTVTGLPEAGTVVTRGQALYQVDGTPVVLLHGALPVYRSLAVGDEGADVQQLNANLVALGHADGLDGDEFTSATANALEELQEVLGMEETGRLELGDAVFLPADDARISAVAATLGAPAPQGATVLQATSTVRVVRVDLETSRQSDVHVGDPVTVTLPDGRTTPGKVSAIATVAIAPPAASAPGGGAEEDPTIEVEVTLDDPAAAGSLDQAPVHVTITTDTVEDALVVPVVALVSPAGGGYAVEVVKADGHDLVTVELGLFDDASGLVQITGSGLAEGQRVVVPRA